MISVIFHSLTHTQPCPHNTQIVGFCCVCFVIKNRFALYPFEKKKMELRESGSFNDKETASNEKQWEYKLKSYE